MSMSVRLSQCLIDAEIKRQHDLDLAYKRGLQNISSLVKKQNKLFLNKNAKY
jgi:hypothetical protein